MARKKSSEKICITFFKKIQSNAIKRGLSFDLDIDYLWDLFLKQNKKIYISNIQYIIKCLQRPAAIVKTKKT